MTNINELKIVNKTPGKRTPFESLPPERREKILEKMERDLLFWQNKREQRRNENR